MDGSVLDHSDSDSGDSWTLLDHSPAFADEAPDLAEHPAKSDTAESTERDEDTDGISIISDSDPESATHCEFSCDKCTISQESRPTGHQIPEYVSISPHPININDDHESINDDFLGDSNGKLKTYVHRRNKRLSTVLNIIVLGSVITAAGVAIGHMWGIKNECSMNTVPSVNKILSRLYKLQEENAFLRNKLKEFTLVNSVQMQQRRLGSEKVPPSKQQKCRKVFEESLNNKNVDKLTKCVEDDKLLDNQVDRDLEQEYLHDIDKLKNVYQQNRSWLDREIARRMKHEDQYAKKLKYNLKSPKSTRINEEHKPLLHNDTIVKTKLESIIESPINTGIVINVTELVQPVLEVGDETADKKITYADSLKSGHKINKRNVDEMKVDKNKREYIRNKKPHKESDVISENSVSDDELKKDDRYNEQKFKPERKKDDRQKIHKKQKRRNKYEQWEMKGGYMKDYDDFSIASSQENEYILKNPDKNFRNRDFLRNNYLNQLSQSEGGAKTEDLGNVERKPKGSRGTKREKGKGDMEKNYNWYEKRVALRMEARKKLEQELFEDSSPNNAGWYFRRMQRREQCRVKGDNSTHKKFTKRVMNFKTKH